MEKVSRSAREALEEAARICEDEETMQPLTNSERATGRACATAIRALAASLSSDAPVSEPAQCRVEGSSVMMGWTNTASPTEKVESATPSECPACWGNGYTAGDSETDKVPCGICAETGKVLPYFAASASAPREWHDRLGAMIDQVGHPDYSLREMVGGLRKLRDDMLAVVDGGAKREGP